LRAKIVPPQQADKRYAGYAAFAKDQLETIRKREKMANAQYEGTVVMTIRPPHPDCEIERHER